MKNLTALLLLLPALVLGEPSTWLKKENPNELYAIVRIGQDCPYSNAELKDVVHGVFIRSRIKPMNSVGRDELALDVELSCIKNGSLWVYSAEIAFTKVSSYKDKTILYTKREQRYYSWFGQDDKDGTRAVIQTRVEMAITEYLKVNFNLGEDDE